MSEANIRAARRAVAATVRALRKTTFRKLDILDQRKNALKIRVITNGKANQKKFPHRRINRQTITAFPRRSKPKSEIPRRHGGPQIRTGTNGVISAQEKLQKRRRILFDTVEDSRVDRRGRWKITGPHIQLVEWDVSGQCAKSSAAS
jgi:hypothetical protein